MSSAAQLQTMQALEAALLHDDHSHAVAALERLLASEFIEVNSFGGETSRSEVLQWLLQKDPVARWQFNEFTVHELAEGLCLVRYHAQQVAPQRSGSKGARHVSLWGFDAVLQCWQLRFHQATKVL